jgi:hypothetical protein
MTTIAPKLTGEKLLKAAVNQILAHPETWDQSQWHSHCGTKHCIAGWCQILAGLRRDDATASSDAANALGISSRDATFLFQGNRTIGQIYHFAKNFNRAGFDRAGFNRAGFNRAGFDRAGFNRAGFNRAGFDRDGFNRAGFNRAGFDRDGFNRAGFNRDGFNHDGFNRDGEKLQPFDL